MIQPSHFWVCIQKNWNQDLRDMHSHAHCSNIYNSQDVKTTKMFIFLIYKRSDMMKLNIKNKDVD